MVRIALLAASLGALSAGAGDLTVVFMVLG
jgi:hypothetical protein